MTTKMPEFSNNWFAEQAQPLWERHLLPHKQGIRRYLEIGACEGQSLHWVLTRLEVEKAYAIDPWERVRFGKHEEFIDYHEAFQRNLRPWIEQGVVETLKGRSFDVLRERHKKIPDQSIDLCYVDGAHRAWDTMADLVLVWPKLRSGTGKHGEGGGIVVVDDCHRRWLTGKPLVLPAVHAFVSTYDSRYRVLFWEPRQIAFRKTK